MARWRTQMLAPPSRLDRAARGVQQRIARAIPEAVHATVTEVVRRLTETILAGSDFVNADPVEGLPLAERDRRALALIADYRKVAAVEGGISGAGGFWLALADFPAFIVIKIRLLFDLARTYGHDTGAFAERLYLLRVFELAFSSAERRAAVFHDLEAWDEAAHVDPQAFDWRTFQQQYRDAIDLAKLAQLIPVIGAPVGAAVNWRLTERVGGYAVNAYRMRWLAR